jgi:hypothetical protein
MQIKYWLWGLVCLIGVHAAVVRAEPSGQMIECANLIYAGVKSSICFSESFLSAVSRDTTIRTSRKFKPVKLSEKDIFEFPFVIMTGEGDFSLTPGERDHMARYLNRGGFLLASAGCSNEPWDVAFRQEMQTLFPDRQLKPIAFDHPLFSMVYTIKRLETKQEDARLEGLEIDGKLVVVYTPDGLNDTHSLHGCCCCGGNEIKNSREVNVNIITYALLQ